MHTILTRLYDEVMNRSFREELTFVYQHEPSELLLAKLTIDQKLQVEDIIGRFDAIGYRVKKHLLRKADALRLFSRVVVKSAQKLVAYINEQRLARKEDANDEWTYPDFVDTLLRCGLPQRILFVLGRRSVAQVRV
jgi:hypothetical protein